MNALHHNEYADGTFFPAEVGEGFPNPQNTRAKRTQACEVSHVRMDCLWRRMWHDGEIEN